MINALRRALGLAGGAALLLAAACSSDTETKAEKRSQVPLYEPCAADSECAPLPDRAVRCECAGGETTVCVEYAAIGEDCFDDSWCPTGSICTGDQSDSDGVRRACVRLPVEGESCLGLPCAPGFACRSDFTCGPPVPRLQRCDEFDLQPCESGNYCESGVCMRQSPPGGLCQKDSHCPDGNHCRIEADGLGYCQVSYGAECKEDFDCVYGLRCEDGVCRSASPLQCEKN